VDPGGHPSQGKDVVNVDADVQVVPIVYEPERDAFREAYMMST
jgi:hypothetical protein